MAQTPQPGFLSAWVNAFTAFDEAHGFAVNVFVVAALAVTGAAFLSGRPRLIRPVLIGFTVLCLADWVLIEDLGFLGGLGTDPNSMIPMVLLAAAGYLAVARAPAEAAEPASRPAAAASWRDRLRIAAAPRTLASASISSVAVVGAIGVIILGAAPMAAAQASPVADTILAQAIDGSSTPLDSRRPRVQPHRPARPGYHAGQPARQGGAADLPGPGLHHRLPAGGTGIPPGRAAARRG